MGADEDIAKLQAELAKMTTDRDEWKQLVEQHKVVYHTDTDALRKALDEAKVENAVLVKEEAEHVCRCIHTSTGELISAHSWMLRAEAAETSLAYLVDRLRRLRQEAESNTKPGEAPLLSLSAGNAFVERIPYVLEHVAGRGKLLHAVVVAARASVAKHHQLGLPPSGTLKILEGALAEYDKP